MKLVTSFDQLRAGSRVVNIDCDCGKIHESMCVELTDRLCPPGEVEWYVEPDCCDFDPASFIGISAGDIQRRTIFLVDTGLSREQTTAKADAKERAR